MTRNQDLSQRAMACLLCYDFICKVLDLLRIVATPTHSCKEWEGFVATIDNSLMSLARVGYN